MATYSEQDKERMLKYPITSILRLLGRRTDHQGCMYYSPFRDESSPSMHINEAKNIWNDFGEGSGGDVFTLVTRLLGCRGGEAWDYLAGLDPNVIPVASLTRFQEEEARAADGKKDVSYYRTNTFPPRITDSLLPTDISTMLEAGARIRQVDDDPNLVWAVMKDIVTEGGNVEKLRAELASKIQAAESKHKAEELHPEEMGNAAAKKRQVHRS